MSDRLALQFADIHAAIGRVFDLDGNSVSEAATGRAPPRLDVLRDSTDGSVQLALRLPCALTTERVRLAKRTLQVAHGAWVKLQVHDEGAWATRTYVLHGSNADDLPLASRRQMVFSNEDSGPPWTIVTWRIAPKHDTLDAQQLRAVLVAAVESFWLGCAPGLELHVSDSDSMGTFSLWRPAADRKSLAPDKPSRDETTLLRAVRRAGSAAARCSHRASVQHSTTVSGWGLRRGQSAVQCCMHWCPDCPASATPAHAEDDEPSSIVRLLTMESFQVGGIRPVHEAFAAIAKTWEKEFGIKLIAQDKCDHTSYCFDPPLVRAQLPVSGVLTVAIDEPSHDLAAANVGRMRNYVSVAQRAAGQAVDALASRDIVFISQRRLRRQQFVPSIAQKLSWMLCKIGNEAVLSECASALGVEYAELATDTDAIASSYQQHDLQDSAASADSASKDGGTTSNPDADENSPHHRVVSKMSAGLTTYLNAQLREACPAVPDSKEVARACRPSLGKKQQQQKKKTKRKQPEWIPPAAVKEVVAGIQEVVRAVKEGGEIGFEHGIDSVSRVASKSSAAACRSDNEQSMGMCKRTPDVGCGVVTDTATGLGSDWSEVDDFESDNWSDSECIPGSTSDAAIPADGFESDDWSDSAPDQSTPSSALGFIRDDDNDGGGGGSHGAGRPINLIRSVNYQHRGTAANDESDFSSTDSDTDQDDPCMIEASWSAHENAATVKNIGARSSCHDVSEFRSG